MKRRTLDIVFVIGGVVMAVLMAVLGMVLKSNANFAKKYVKDQLTEQQITFTPAGFLQKGPDWQAALLKSFGGDQTAVDKFLQSFTSPLKAEADSACLAKYGTGGADDGKGGTLGQLMTTGKMAECYANDYIRLHLADGSVYAAKFSANPAWQVAQGWTYATIGSPQRELGKQITDATAANPTDPKIDDLKAEKAKVDAIRDTLFRGESLRGLLLTSYGFSIFGEKAALAATVPLHPGARPPAGLHRRSDPLRQDTQDGTDRAPRGPAHQRLTPSSPARSPALGWGSAASGARWPQTMFKASRKPATTAWSPLTVQSSRQA